MKAIVNTPLNGNHQWPSWQKIAFRLFFVFLSLQVLTENFIGPIFNFSPLVWKLAEKIWIPPTLWLNKRIFHFNYLSEGWTTFSAVLHTIRDTVYLLAACLAAAIWTIIDQKRANYDKLFYWFSESLVIALSCMIFSYGIIKIFPLQMRPPTLISLYKPMGDQNPYELLFDTLGFGEPYVVFSGLFEALGAVLILFKRTRVVGLLVIICLMLNIVMLNYAFHIGVLITSFYMLLIALFLLARYAGQIMRFFFTRETALLPWAGYAPAKNGKTKLFKAITLVFLGISFFINTRSARSLYITSKITSDSRRYSLVKNYVAGNDTLKLVDKDTVCWRIWSERMTNGKPSVTIATMNAAGSRSYWLTRDTAKGLLTLRPAIAKDSSLYSFTYKELGGNNWRLEGIFKQKDIRVELQRISPDTTMTLMKPKRSVIVTNDAEE